MQDRPSIYIALMLRLITGNLFNDEKISDDLIDAAMTPFVEMMGEDKSWDDDE